MANLLDLGRRFFAAAHAQLIDHHSKDPIMPRPACGHYKTDLPPPKPTLNGLAAFRNRERGLNDGNWGAKLACAL
jgi:hypothetical protein